jgi:hypothetical protein
VDDDEIQLQMRQDLWRQELLMSKQQPPAYVQPAKTYKQALNELLVGATEDKVKQEYRLRDGTKVSFDYLANASVITLEAMAHRLQRIASPNRQPMLLPSVGSHVTNGTIVTWKSKGIFTYAAVKAGDAWFITGTGEFYGGNTFMHGDFIVRVLGAAEVSDIQIVTDLLPLKLPI